MKKRGVMLVLVGVLTVGVALLVWPRQPVLEPEYQGKKLSEWLYYENPPGQPYASIEAIRQMGANAIPTLLRWAQYREPRWKSFASTCFAKLPPLLQVKSIEWYLAPSKIPFNSLSVTTFWILHEEAA